MTRSGREAAMPDLKKYRIVQGDAIDSLKRIPDKSCQLAVSSPPYNIRKPYERTDDRTLDEYIVWQSEVIELLSHKLTDGGSICWQVGTYVNNGELFPLDHIFIDIFRSLEFKLRNRIVWTYNFGYNADRRFSGRYETLLWLTKSDQYFFNLDPVRVPQLYPGKRHSSRKGPDRAGRPSGNPLGKNPSDVWEFSAEVDFVKNPVWRIPNVKAKHPEHTEHPCQFPVELAERCVLAMTQPGDIVIDPFVGTGASVIAAVMHGRRGVGIDRDERYVAIARRRLRELAAGALKVRPSGQGTCSPVPTSKVARVPDEWQLGTEPQHGAAS